MRRHDSLLFNVIADVSERGERVSRLDVALLSGGRGDEFLKLKDGLGQDSGSAAQTLSSGNSSVKKRGRLSMAPARLRRSRWFGGLVRA